MSASFTALTMMVFVCGTAFLSWRQTSSPLPLLAFMEHAEPDAISEGGIIHGATRRRAQQADCERGSCLDAIGVAWSIGRDGEDRGTAIAPVWTVGTPTALWCSQGPYSWARQQGVVEGCGEKTGERGARSERRVLLAEDARGRHQRPRAERRRGRKPWRHNLQGAGGKADSGPHSRSIRCGLPAPGGGSTTSTITWLI
jgi:hypothetical protein